jgi:hypothetical protein
MALDPEYQKIIDQWIAEERRLERLKVMRELSQYRPVRYSYGFPFDLLATIIQGVLSLVEQVIQRSVAATLDFIDSWRKK